MFNEWTQSPLDDSMTVQVIRHPTATFADILLGGTTDDVDISDYVSRITMSAQDMSLQLAWHMELYESLAHPRVGELYAVFMKGQLLQVGILQEIRDYGENKGQRRMTLTVRSRDASPLWREAKVVTDSYSMGTDLIEIAKDVLDFLGVGETERLLPATLGVFTVHSSIQMADVSAWEVLTTIGFPAGLEPHVDAVGRFKFVSRSVDRLPVRVLTADRLESVGGSRSKAKTTRVRVKWLDPNLTKSSQQEQVLGNATITAGFFQLEQAQDVYFSDDRSQRAEATRMVIRQTCNSGLLPVARESYSQRSEKHGRITLDTEFWVPLLATASIAAMQAAAKIPDGVIGGKTVPIGRVVHAAAEAAIMIVMMSIGTGVYEVWGVPYDFVHAVNTTEAFAENVPAWAEVISDLSNDFIMNEPMAQATAVRELLYENLSASSHTLTAVDDPALEKGDIIQLPDGSRVYITGYSRTLERDKAHNLTLEGFRV